MSPNFLSKHFKIAKIIEKERVEWQFSGKSSLARILLGFIFIIFALISISYTVILFFKIYPIVFTTLMTRLGIASWLRFPIIITTLLGCLINIPLFIILETRSILDCRKKIELYPICLFKVLLFPSYKSKYNPYSYIGLNVAGGLIPLVLALYQFSRVKFSAILIVTAIVTFISYFLVKIIPKRGICTTQSRLWGISGVAALLAMQLIDGGVDRFDVSVAFAGAVLGMTIGADLLHLKDVRPQYAEFPLSIGGAGLNDLILKSGIIALVIAEWFPAVSSWISVRLG